VIGLDKFHLVCGISFDAIRTVMYAYLFSTSVCNKEEIYFNYGLDITRLSWIKYHDIEDPEIIFSCIGNVGLNSKGKSQQLCLICNASSNLIVYDDRYYITTSPQYLSGDRVPLSLGGNVEIQGCHFVVWTKQHREVDEDDRVSLSVELAKMFKTLGVKSKWPYEVYVHGKMQYGHGHFHVISGDYYTVRCREIMYRCQVAVNNDEEIEDSDFFHPITDFMSNLFTSSLDYFTTALLIKVLRIKFSFNFEGLVMFYKMVAPEGFYRLRDYIEKQYGQCDTDESID
jgi:hypothetical protein